MAGGARARPRRCVLVYQASREGLFLRLASALLLTSLAVAPLRAAAQEDPWATFSYVKPAPVYRLRLGLEETGMIAAALTGYLIKAPQPSDPNVPSFSLWEKLRFAPGSGYLDVDELATNFVGHPTAGTFYYMFARSNRVLHPGGVRLDRGGLHGMGVPRIQGAGVDQRHGGDAGGRSRHRRGLHAALRMVRLERHERPLQGPRLDLRFR